ncbi:iron chelate uptake ABC transporter family permease subunit [uncultured Gimesia sp.]|jgi:manganese/zinc/iron transport system permease protein|uniref:metal ABC transporter permease n=1 Tax=uncultured Gimesia sp. TaxID=1678688 RepID=UPI00262936C3|nr:iron chelate uptake ABC transporter family permease subunit [uncultured Gimesia sp.]
MRAFALVLLFASFWPHCLVFAATESGEIQTQESITDRSIAIPEWKDWKRVFLLQDYNTRVVILGTTLLGMAAGMIGSFALLRKRALMGDALSHATLPGIAIAFILATSLGLNGKSLPILLTGAAVSGLLGIGGILLIRNLTRLKEDAALGIVLSVFFGAGIALLGVVQQMQTGHAAGLESFIYGKTASMVASDAWLIGSAGLTCMLISILLYKELTLLCFDEGFAISRGFPVVLLDMTLMGLVVVVTIIGLQAVGLILMISLLVIPPAAARFWTEKMAYMSLVAIVLGALSGMIGSAMSAIFPNLPSGAMIVLVATTMFLFSMVFGIPRGILIRKLRRHQLNSKVDRQHLLRGLYEYLEARGLLHDKQTAESTFVPLSTLLQMRSWSPAKLKKIVKRAQREQLVVALQEDQIRLTRSGLLEAARIVHEHRLWELYLITYADVAASKVDQDADAIEHVLEPEVIAELESLLVRQSTVGVLQSPHAIQIQQENTNPRQSDSRRAN